ncbi:MAG: oligopeptide transporter, OPT family [Elusimicrobiota bacterium]|nr:oligopeptide transporter, OPT family [Elusimicrobiota bacterium]
MSSDQHNFKPYVASDKQMKEFTLRAVIIGIGLGVVFGAGNAFLGLKVGMTVSASIPAAVVSMALLRSFFRGGTILENNIVQTVASTGESLAAGVIFTIPAMFLLGYNPSIFMIFWLTLLGGVLGVLFMIPLRRYLIVKEHGKLPYPEGTACAEILKVGEEGGGKAWYIVFGGLLGGAYKFLMSGVHLWESIPGWTLNFYQRAIVNLEATPALLGVGFIIGPRIAAVMLAGGALGWWVIIPMIKMFAAGSAIAIYPSDIAIAQMNSDDIWSNYVRYIGAGAVAFGGLVGLVKSGPIIMRSFKLGFSEITKGFSHRKGILRTADDLPMSWVIFGAAAIILLLWMTPGLGINIVAVGLVVLLGFFFVTVASLTVGLVGSSSNPVSGMTITALLITCLLFVFFGWTEKIHMIAAMTVGAVICIAICIAGDTSQDLKTGYLLGATPKYQQLAEILAVLVPAVAMGGVLYLLHSTYGIGGSELPAPQATLMAMVVKGVMSNTLPWTLIIFGMMIAAVVELMGIGSLPFAIGLYLPVSLSTPIMVGGLVSLFVSKMSVNKNQTTEEKHKAKQETMDRGILVASGLVAGDALMGILIAILAAAGLIAIKDVVPMFGSGVGLTIFMFVAIALGVAALKKLKK